MKSLVILRNELVDDWFYQIASIALSTISFSNRKPVEVVAIPRYIDSTNSNDLTFFEQDVKQAIGIFQGLSDISVGHLKSFFRIRKGLVVK